MPDSTSPDLLATILRVQQETLAEVRQMRGDLARRGAKSLAVDDLVALETLLPAIYATVGRLGLVFTAAELVKFAQSQYHGAPQLLAGLERTVAAGGSTVRRVGKLLSRANGFVVSGLRVEAVRPGRDGMIWMVRPRVSRDPKRTLAETALDHPR